jgi:phosphonate transport system substrate-binding protein
MDGSRFRSRRDVLGACVVALAGAASAEAASLPTFRFGLTPVFLTSDLELLTKLRGYLERRLGQEVELVQRRTYEEITSLLVSGQIAAAWICGFPFVAYRAQLDLVAVPVWRGRPLYQSYLIARKGRGATSLGELQGDVHAFSDPNSNSGYLVTTAMLAERKLQPRDFFRQTFFTYGHRNVVRAVASGLAQSGSVDGYVWEVMQEIEHDLTSRTEVVHASEWLGFPPIACPRQLSDSASINRFREALTGMSRDADGRDVLRLLRLDGFAQEQPSLFDTIAAKLELVRSFG